MCCRLFVCDFKLAERPFEESALEEQRALIWFLLYENVKLSSILTGMPAQYSYVRTLLACTCG